MIGNPLTRSSGWPAFALFVMLTAGCDGSNQAPSSQTVLAQQGHEMRADAVGADSREPSSFFTGEQGSQKQNLKVLRLAPGVVAYSITNTDFGKKCEVRENGIAFSKLFFNSDGGDGLPYDSDEDQSAMESFSVEVFDLDVSGCVQAIAIEPTGGRNRARLRLSARCASACAFTDSLMHAQPQATR